MREKPLTPEQQASRDRVDWLELRKALWLEGKRAGLEELAEREGWALDAREEARQRWQLEHYGA